MVCVLVCNPKGGSGKTTLAVNLASAFAAGGFETGLADADRQQSALAWLARRPVDLAPIHGYDWVRRIRRPPRQITRVVVDSAANMRPRRFRALLKMADVVVVPVLPSAFDRVAIRRFLEIVEEAKPIRRGRKRVAVVANRHRPNTRASESLLLFLDEVGHPPTTLIPDRSLYVDSAEDGIGVFDRRDRTAREALPDWTPLFTFVEGGAAQRQ